MKKAIFGATAAAALLVAGAASAATVSVTLTGYGTDVAGAVAARDAFLGPWAVVGHEDFEDFTAYDDADYDVTPLPTDVGTFTSIGDAGSGSTQVFPAGEAVVRSAAFPGTSATGSRYDADGDEAGGTNYLDSNDGGGISLAIAGLGMFDRIAFLLTDVDDVGSALFNIKSDGNLLASNNVVQGNGKLFLVTVSISELIDQLTLDMMIDTGDGFGIDGVKIVATPIPAAGFLLLGGLGALGFASRRKRKDA